MTLFSGFVWSAVCGAESAKPQRVFGAPQPKRTESGLAKRWYEQKVAIQVDPALEQVLPGATLAAEQAFGAWQGGQASLPQFSITLGLPANPGVGNGINEIIHGPIEVEGHAKDLAITIASSDEQTGELLEADVFVNALHPLGLLDDAAESRAMAEQKRDSSAKDQQPANDESGDAEEPAILPSCDVSAEAAATCGNRYDLASILTHEAGHVVGLGDDRTEASATMFYCTSPCETHKREPTSAELNAAAEVYASGFDQSQCTVANLGVFRSRSSGGLGSVPCFLAVVALCHRVRTRPRRRK